METVVDAGADRPLTGRPAWKKSQRTFSERSARYICGSYSPLTRSAESA